MTAIIDHAAQQSGDAIGQPGSDAIGQQPDDVIGQPAGHLLRLPGTDWSIWRQSVLRGAGFPARGVAGLSQPDLAEAADRAASGATDRETYLSVYGRATGRLSEQIRQIAADPAFREAVLWQNRQLIPDCVDKAAAGEPRNVRGRNHELTIASYWQRYCVKNDTIGYFGPVGWASWVARPEPLRVVPGARLLARRTTYFEAWAVDEVARALERDPALLPWLPPRLVHSYDLVGTVLHRPTQPPVVLTGQDAELIGLCDGSRTAREVADEILWSGHPELDTEESVLAALVSLRDRGLVHLGLEGPVSARPEQDLLAKLRRIGDQRVRESVLARLARLTAARDAVADAAGDERRLAIALGQAAERFEEATGAASTRRPGQTYAGRSILYEDTVRDVDVRLGQPVIDALAVPLALLLHSARWFVAEATRAYRRIFDDAYDRVRQRLGSEELPLAALVAAATPHLYLSLRQLPAPVAELVVELQRRWAEILRPPPGVSRHAVRAQDIADKVATAFAAPEPAWAAAVHHAPDLMIAAAGAEAVARGDFLIVLGELHVASNTVESRLFVEQHPDPSWLLRADEADHGSRRIYLSPPKHWAAVNSRTYPPSALLSPQYTYWSLHPDTGGTPAEPISAARIVVRRVDGRLVAGTRDGGRQLDFFELVGELLSGAVVNGFHPLPPAAHVPRVAIDRLVIARESWTLDATEVPWARHRNEADRFLAARAWRAELGLPERAFYKVPVEDKPVYVDFTSLVLVNLFAKSLRRTAEVAKPRFTITEMLPDVHETWLTDAAGAGYTAEIRVVAVDPSAASVMRQDADPAAPSVIRQDANPAAASAMRWDADDRPAPLPLEEELTGYLREILPDYMVPAAVVELAALPRTPNHKVDVNALPPPRIEPASPPVSADGEHDELERDLATFWAELLKRDGVAAHDDFFRIGGNSLLVMRVIAHVAKRYAVGVPAEYVFENPTVSALARRVRTAGTPAARPTPVGPDAGATGG